MRVVDLSDEAMARKIGSDAGSYRTAIEAIKAELNAPLELAGCSKVIYDSKTDRYVVTFARTDRTASLKATDAVAEFATANINRSGCWLGRMENGVLVDLYLIRL